MTPYYQDDAVTIWHGDAEDIMPTITAGSVDLVLTDPPYNVSVRNGRDGTTPGKLKRKDGTARKVQRDFGDWDRDWSAASLLLEAERMLREGGSMIAFTSEFLMGEYVTSTLNHRCLLYWQKTNPTPAFYKLYVRAIEMMVWQAKGKGWTWNANGYHKNVYTGPIIAGHACANGEPREHPTQKPLWLMRALLTIHSNAGDLVVDPYMGSGSTLRAARDLGRRSVGIELNERYCEIAAKRVGQGVIDFMEEPA